MFACYTRAVLLLMQSTTSGIAKTEWHSTLRLTRKWEVRGFYRKAVRIHLVSPYTGKLVPVQNIKPCGGVEVYIHSFLTSAVRGGEWPASRPGHFTPGESLLFTDQESGWASEAAQILWRRTEYLAVAKHVTMIPRTSSPYQCHHIEHIYCSQL